MHRCCHGSEHEDGAPVSETAGRSTGAPRATGTSTPALRWRNVFPGDERQLGTLRRWLAELLPACPARDGVGTVAVELGADGVKFATGGGGGGGWRGGAWGGPAGRGWGRGRRGPARARLARGTAGGERRRLR